MTETEKESSLLTSLFSYMNLTVNTVAVYCVSTTVAVSVSGS